MAKRKRKPTSGNLFKNRIVGQGSANPKDIKKNSKNWRKHPESQEWAMQGVLEKVGWVDDIIVNKRTGNLVDGHLRVDLAIKNKEDRIPFKLVDLTKEEEDLILLTFDPITSMASENAEFLKNLSGQFAKELDNMHEGLADLIDLLRDEAICLTGGDERTENLNEAWMEDRKALLSDSRQQEEEETEEEEIEEESGEEVDVCPHCGEPL